MKMIIAIMRDSDYDPITQALINAGFRVTRIASTGGFLRRGSSTLMIGIEDEKVENALQVIRENAGPVKSESEEKRATLFVLNIEHFSQT